MVWFFLAMLPVSTAWSQEISGFVRDSVGQPIAFASVVANSCPDDRVIGFGQSDALGKYRILLKSPCDSVTITARFFGYRPGRFSALSTALPLSHDFALASEALQTVVIKGKSPPVVVRGDTTEYNVSSFADSTERSMEDLIRKLPGFSVNENGVIQYNGKMVERVLIEGDDVFGENYTMGTRNIRADMFSKVQVVDRFQDNPLMQGIRESDRMVLNLKINPDRKRALSGNVELGSGAGDEWKALARTNVFSISRKDKMYLIGNANNSGGDPLGWTEYQAEGGAMAAVRQQSLQSNPLPRQSLLRPNPLEDAELPWVHTQNNRSGLLYLGVVLPAKNGTKTTLSGWAGQTKLDQSAGNAQQYLLGADAFELLENKNALNSKTGYAVQAESSLFSKDSKQALRSFLKLSRKTTLAQTDLLRSQPNADPFRIGESAHETTDDGFLSFEYTYKNKSNQVLQLVSKTAFQQNKNNLNSAYAWYASYFQVDTSYRFLQQPTDQLRAQQLLMGSWLGSRKALKWSVDAGSSWYQASIRHEAALLTQQGDNLPLGPQYANDFRLSTLRFFVLPALSWSHKAASFKASAGLSWRPARLTVGTAVGNRVDVLAIEPRVEYRQSTGPNGTLVAHAELKQQMPDVLALAPAYAFTGYQTISSGLPIWVGQPSYFAVVSYQYLNRVQQSSWQIIVNHTNNPKRFGTRTQIDPFLTVNETIWPLQYQSYSVNSHAEHYFSPLRTRLKAALGWTRTAQASAVNNDEPVRLLQNTTTAQIEGGTAFDGWINFLLTNQLMLNVGRFGNEKQAPQALMLFSQLQCNIKPAKTLDLKIFVYRLSNPNGGEQYKASYASDAAAYWRWPKQRATLSLSAVNLLNADRYARVFADALSEQTTFVRAVRPFFLIGLDKSF
jgi:hypothetical protein